MEKARPKSDFGNILLPNKPVATTTSKILSSTNTTHPADTTQLEQQGMLGKFNQAPDEYEIDKLDEYDTEYLREIVKDLHAKARKVKKMTDKALAIMKSPDDYAPPPLPGEEVHWKHPTEIHFMIKEDIDKYNESTCKHVLKEAAT